MRHTANSETSEEKCSQKIVPAFYWVHSVCVTIIVSICGAACSILHAKGRVIDDLIKEVSSLN